MSNKLIFKGTPVAKPRMTQADRWKKRPVVEKYWTFKDNIVKQAKKQNFELGNSYEITFIIQLPKSMSEKKKKEYDGKAHMVRPDLDNLQKSANDCLLEEDSTVHTTVARKIWGREGRIIIKNM